MVRLTKRQRELADVARKNGKISMRDAFVLYSDRRSAVNAVQRLVLAGVLREGMTCGVFVLNGSTH